MKLRTMARTQTELRLLDAICGRLPFRFVDVELRKTESGVSNCVKCDEVWPCA